MIAEVDSGAATDGESKVEFAVEDAERVEGAYAEYGDMVIIGRKTMSEEDDAVCRMVAVVCERQPH